MTDSREWIGMSLYASPTPARRFPDIPHGCWVACNQEEKAIAHSPDIDEAINKASELGESDPIMWWQD